MGNADEIKHFGPVQFRQVQVGDYDVTDLFLHLKEGAGAGGDPDNVPSRAQKLANFIRRFRVGIGYQNASLWHTNSAYHLFIGIWLNRLESKFHFSCGVGRGILPSCAARRAASEEI